MFTTTERAQHHTAAGTAGTGTLRNLYLLRFAFAIVWGAVITAAAETLDPVVVVLLVGYPLFDVVAAVVDYRSSGTSGPRALLAVNIALSLLTAIGLAAAGSGVPGVLRVWGAWAITAGIVQLIVAVQRRRLGGQLPMVLSGGISVLAGGGFVAMAGGPHPAVSVIGGYAIAGGVFFLISAIRLHVVTGKAVD